MIDLSQLHNSKSMKQHASLNRIYRLVWNQTLNIWVAVAETAKGRGKSASRSKIMVSATAVAAALSLGLSPPALAAPTDGQVVAGAGSISQAGNTTTINQNSQNLAINWQDFSIAANETVHFNQPNSSSMVLNRVIGQNSSQIFGAMSANGQVFILNPNGVLFGAGSQVNVGGLVASTLSLSDEDFLAGKYSFSNNGSAGSITNQGTLTAVQSGYIALLAPQVLNEGVISATLGKAVLAAGDQVTLNLSQGSLLGFIIDQGAFKALVDNKQLIEANGGQVFMSAKAADAITTAMVNNSGIIEARTMQLVNGTVQMVTGTIMLMSDMNVGTVNVGGTLDASAPNGGDGGFIETSAAHVHIADDVNITTAAPSGNTGSWLIDPVDFTVAATGGDITGSVLSGLLNSNDITIQTTTGTNDANNLYGTAGTNGDIFINDAISWIQPTKLTLNAIRNININQSITATSTNGSLALLYGQGAANAGNTASVNMQSPINLKAGDNFSMKLGNDPVAATQYKVITDLGLAGSITGTDLQGINGNIAGNYVLGSNIDATATSTWNANGASFDGFAPIGDGYTTSFSGSFNGLGHTITGLTINRTGASYIGLFGATADSAVLSNIGLVGGTVTGTNFVGSLVGRNRGSISNSYTTSNVAGNDYIGALAGGSYGSVNKTYATASVTGNSMVGGLLGFNFGSVSNSYASGKVIAADSPGGLVGYNFSGSVSNSYWDKDTTNQLGSSGGGTGLSTADSLLQSKYVGFDFDNTWFMVNNYTRPFLRSEYSTEISNAHQLQLTSMNLNANYTLANNIDLTSEFTKLSGMWATDTSPATTIGAGFLPIGDGYTTLFGGSFNGLGHTIFGLTINRAGSTYVGLFGATAGTAVISNTGLVGGSVTGGSWTGGLVGRNRGSISNSYTTTDVTGRDYVGGLVGVNYGTVSNSYNTASVTGNSIAGGLLGYNAGSIGNSYATGRVIANDSPGGVIGYNGGSLSNIYWDKDTTGQLGSSGGGTGLTSDEIKNLASFSSWGTTINNTGASGAVWRIYEGKTGPLLTSFMTTLSLADNSLTYNGAIQSGTSSSATGVLGTAATGTNASMYNNGYFSDQQGYNIVGGNLTINAAPISMTSSRVYDGTLAVDHSIFSLSGLVNSENLTLTGSGLITDKNVGTNKTVTLDSLALGNGTGTGAGTASNYSFTGGALIASITTKALTATATATNKVYDGSSFAAATLAITDGLIVGETVTATVAATFNSKNVVDANTVTVNSNTLVNGTNGLASNYSLSAGQTATAAITAKVLTQSGLSVAASKTFDGTTAATVIGSASLLPFIYYGSSTDGAAYVGDDVRLDSALSIGSYNSSEVASANSVSFSGKSLTGVSASNYSLAAHADAAATITELIIPQPTAAFTAAVAAKDAIVASFASAANSATTQFSSSTPSLASPFKPAVTKDSAATQASAPPSKQASSQETGSSAGENPSIAPQVGDVSVEFHGSYQVVGGGVNLPSNMLTSFKAADTGTQDQ
jgi:filamentous hemagglutinin family protein